MIAQPPVQIAQQVESLCAPSQQTHSSGPGYHASEPNGVERCQPDGSLKARPKASSPHAIEQSGAAQEVVVTAERLPVRSELDRRVYDIRKDLNSQSGSLADVLKNLPSVDVDPFGRVLLRGAAGVTILVDGRPSGLFQGAARGDALLQTPASQVDKIEVMTVPSSEFTSTGTGGIINIILRKPTANHPRTGSVRTNAGAEGRSSGGVLLSSGWRNLGTILSINVKHDSRRNSSIDDSIGLSPLPPSDLAQTANDRSVSDSLSMHTAITFAPTKSNEFSADFDVFYLHSIDKGVETYNQTGSSAGAYIAYMNPYRYVGDTSSVNTSLTYKVRSGSGKEEANISFSTGFSNNDSETDQSFQFTPTGSRTTLQNSRYNSPSLESNLVGSVLFRFSPQGSLKVGSEVKFSSSTIKRSGESADVPEPLIVSESLADRFRLDRSVFAAYLQLANKRRRFSYLGGIRLESSRDDQTGAYSVRGTGSEFVRAFPSVHLGYALTKFEKILLSYDERVQRPSMSELDPHVVAQSPFLFTRGTSTLKPSTSTSSELSYEFSKGLEFRSLSIYHKVNRNIISPYLQRDSIEGLLTTYQNVGMSTSTGVEVNQRGEVRHGLTYSVYGNANWTEFGGGNIAARRHSGMDSTLKATLNMAISKDDVIQLGQTFRTISTTAFGFAESASIFSLGARHFFSNGPFLTFTTQDPFGVYYRHQHYVTDELSRDVLQRPHIRAFSLTLTVPFGAKARRDGNIEVE